MAKSSRRCCNCGRAATRTETDSQLCAEIRLCDECPSPREVLAAAAEIRDAWPPWRCRHQTGVVPVTFPTFRLAIEAFERGE
jgi:hypothetical protein